MIEEKQNMGKADAIFMGFHGGGKRYPSWRYHIHLEPIIVKNKEEDEKAKEQGYAEASPPIMANNQIHNWYWDLEDMSAKQLCVWAREEYGVNLPAEAGQERLLKWILEITRFAPKNEGRLIYMAHTIRLNLEETILEIQKAVENASEVEKMEFVA